MRHVLKWDSTDVSRCWWNKMAHCLQKLRERESKKEMKNQKTIEKISFEMKTKADILCLVSANLTLVIYSHLKLRAIVRKRCVKFEIISKQAIAWFIALEQCDWFLQREPIWSNGDVLLQFFFFSTFRCCSQSSICNGQWMQSKKWSTFWPVSMVFHTLGSKNKFL